MLKITQENIKPTFLFIGTILALVPTFILRFNTDYSQALYYKFGTYFGDIWNFFANYLQKGLKFLPEYPAGLRIVYELFNFEKIKNYEMFFLINSLFIVICAILTTYFLYLTVLKTHKNFSSIWYYWILAPSFIFYSLYNYDIPVVLLIVSAYYCLINKKFNFSSVLLAIGTVIKFFPIYLLPLFLFNLPPKKRLNFLFIFLITILLINLPYVISDFNGWIYPYIWQITENISYSMKQQTFWWIFYPYFGKYLGFVSLGLFAGLYILFLFLLRKKPIIFQIVTVLILFLLTDRIYSPQYNLYLLPFLVILPFQINKVVFYVMDLINVVIVFFFFRLTQNVNLLQTLVFIRYGLLIILFLIIYHQAFKVKNAEK